VIEIGRDRYHAEAVFEKDTGVVRLYTLGQDEAKVQEVEEQTLAAFARAEGATDAVSLVFKPEPRPDDAPGKTSQFVARLPRELWGKRLDVTIPTLRIDGERYRVAFTSATGSHEEAEPPAKIADEAERKLYLTPGGKYTQADVEANGHQTASEKFKGAMAAHDLKPQPGDKICPITLTKANAKFTWIVGGKAYEFCCPPCVDEFVQTAKEHPEAIKEPEAYVKEK
jgi:YHS domain-containing protein